MPFVKIVTYCATSSIGSILQAFGLTIALSEMGYKSQIIIEKAIFRRKFSLRQWFFLCVEKLLIGEKIKEAIGKRERFINDSLDVVTFDESMRDKEEMNTVYIAGSDQIWNPIRCFPLYFLDFVKNSKKISYAASMGNTHIPSDKADEFRRLIGHIDVFSVREKECASVIGEYTEKNIEVHLDPTFLIEADQWRRMEKPYKVKGKYILLYMLYWDPSYKVQIKQLKKKTGLPVYAICNGITKVYADKYLFDVGVEEFLWLVDHAEYVISSSFHGVALSIIFNKRFSPIVNPSLPSRINNLLDCLSVPKVSVSELSQSDAFVYSEINRRIKIERERGIGYLKENLGE